MKHTGHPRPTIIPIIKIQETDLRIFYEAILINIFKPIWNGYDAAPILSYSSNLDLITKTKIKIHFLNQLNKHRHKPNDQITQPEPVHNNNTAQPTTSITQPTLRRSTRLRAKQEATAGRSTTWPAT